MTRVSVKHRIDYAYDHKVLLSRHRFRLAPQRDTQAIIEGYSFVLRPANRLYWQYDVYGNKMARADFDEKTDFMSVEVTLEIELTSLNPFDVLVDDESQYFPFCTLRSLKILCCHICKSWIGALPSPHSLAALKGFMVKLSLSLSLSLSWYSSISTFVIISLTCGDESQACSHAR